jgi:hypothetical protein
MEFFSDYFLLIAPLVVGGLLIGAGGLQIQSGQGTGRFFIGLGVAFCMLSIAATLLDVKSLPTLTPPQTSPTQPSASITSTDARV